MRVCDFLSYCFNDYLIVKIWDIEEEKYIYNGEVQEMNYKMTTLYLVESFECALENGEPNLILNVSKPY